MRWFVGKCVRKTGTDLVNELIDCCWRKLATGERDSVGEEWENWCRWMKWETAARYRRGRMERPILLDPWVEWGDQIEWLQEFEEGIARSTDFWNGHRQSAVENGVLRDTAEGGRQRIAVNTGNLRAANGQLRSAIENEYRGAIEGGRQRRATEDGSLLRAEYGRLQVPTGTSEFNDGGPRMEESEGRRPKKKE